MRSSFKDFQKMLRTHTGSSTHHNPIVDFMVNSVGHILETEFGRSLSDSGVHIIDPFVVTGNFIVRLMQDIKGTALEEKYQHELHCNEVMLLPYYIASLNIEQEYYQRMQTYLPFEGITLADTFELLEDRQIQMFTQENTDRVERQKQADMFVVIGNPPYNAWQVNDSDNNRNRKYETMDKRILDTYAADSKAQLKNALYDPYIKAIRWAADRIGHEGIVAFVTNNGFVDGLAFDGMRKHLAEDFDSIFVLDLGGNARKGLKVSDANVFGIRVGVSINLFVKCKQKQTETPQIFYHRTDDLWNKTKKFDFMNEQKHTGNIAWQEIEPNTKNTWLTEGLHAEFDTFIPIGTKETKAQKGIAKDVIFKSFSSGVKTGRDTWVNNYNRNVLINNIKNMIDTYNSEMDRWQRREKQEVKVNDFVRYDDTRIKWDRELRQHLQRGRRAEFAESKVRNSLYRPYVKTNLFFDRVLNNCVYLFPSFFPTQQTEEENRLIWLKVGSDWPMFPLMATQITDLLPQSGSQCFPFYTYNEDGSGRKENITDWALAEFRKEYKDDTITKWDIFHYNYGILHHPEYRDKYQANLRRDLPHIPFAPDFWGFANAGEKLADLHVNYESVPKYDGLQYIETPGVPVDWRVEKMRLSKDKTQLKYNEFLMIDGIPAETYEYRLGTRSALEWVIDQYRVKTDKRSGIVNDPNRADEPRYIVDLIAKVVYVSLETNEIVNGLPELGV